MQGGPFSFLDYLTDEMLCHIYTHVYMRVWPNVAWMATAIEELRVLVALMGQRLGGLVQGLTCLRVHAILRACLHACVHACVHACTQACMHLTISYMIY